MNLLRDCKWKLKLRHLWPSSKIFKKFKYITLLNIKHSFVLILKSKPENESTFHQFGHLHRSSSALNMCWFYISTRTFLSNIGTVKFNIWTWYRFICWQKFEFITWHISIYTFLIFCTSVWNSCHHFIKTKIPIWIVATKQFSIINKILLLKPINYSLSLQSLNFFCVIDQQHSFHSSHDQSKKTTKRLFFF